MKNKESIEGHEEESGEAEACISGKYETVEEWKEVFDKWLKGTPVKGYDRYNYPDLIKREEEVAKLVGVEPGKLLMYNSGMSAIVEALESLSLKKGDVLLYASAVYDQSKEFMQKNLIDRGIKCIPIESGDIDKTKALIDEHHPKVIFTEIVGNDLNMPVTDVDALINKVEQTNEKYQENLGLSRVLEKQLRRRSWIRDWLDIKPGEELNRKQEAKLLVLVDKFERVAQEISQKHSYLPLRELVKVFEAQGITKGMDRRTILLELKSLIDTAWLAKRENPITLIIDNTISTSSGFDLVKRVKESKTPILAVESGTKFYALDKGTFGLLYTNSADKITELKLRRAVTGSYLPPAVEAVLPERNKEEFDVRNKQILSNTKALAQTIAKMVGGELGIKAVSHPNLPTHPNYDYTSKNMPDGGSAVFYISCKDAWKVAKQLQEKLGKRIEFGASFAFEKTRLGVFNDNLLRIAGGTESPEELQQMLEDVESI